MRIRQFSVQGYKNLTATISLDDLPGMVVLHGDNNVGKSNVLEAMVLASHLLLSDACLVAMVHGKPAHMDRLPEPYLIQEVFTLGQIGRIYLELTVDLSREEWSQILVGSKWDSRPWKDEHLNLRLKISLFPGHGGGVTMYAEPPLFFRDIEQSDKADAESVLMLLRLWLKTHPLVRLLSVHRHLLGSKISSDRQIIPHDLTLQLFDARESLDPAEHARWTLFVEMVAQFQDVLGEGEIVATYDRRDGLARLVWQQNGQRIPLHLMGTGVQQVVGLIGYLLMSGADVLAIEEPELNLRYTHQLRLGEVLQKIVDDPRGPSQVFLTSHSPAFEQQGFFFALEVGPDGPHIARRPAAEAVAFTEHVVEPHPGGRAPLSYVTSEGLVLLPTHIREALVLPRGGGVVFREVQAGQVEMWSNEAYLATLGEE